jgi:hypothetical protein
MNSFGLVVHDEQSFLTKVVNQGMEQGIFTRDRADEIIKISVAMANNYVLRKEVDFRSATELSKVQETILKLAGIGLEIRSKGSIEKGVEILMEASPVDLFRLAYTRIEKLRSSWRQLLQDHRIRIMVNKKELDCLSDLTCRRLSETSIFTDTEVHTMSTLHLPDEMFATYRELEYYENELTNYEFILRLRDILPFDLLNRSPHVHAENLAEVDSIREALISTLVISLLVKAEDPVAISMADIRDFLSKVVISEDSDLFTEEIENGVLETIHELAEGLPEDLAGLLTREVVRVVQRLLETVVSEWDTLNSPSESTFFKRWSRLVIVSDMPDPMDRIIRSDEIMDEFDFELVLGQLLARSEEEAVELIDKLPWGNFTPDQLVRLFHQAEQYQEIIAPRLILKRFSADALLDLLEEAGPESIKSMSANLAEGLSEISFSIEELELLARLHHPELVRFTGPPANHDCASMLAQFRTGTSQLRTVLALSAVRADFLSEFIHEAWNLDADAVNKAVKHIPKGEIGHFFEKASARLKKPKIIHSAKGDDLKFETTELNKLFKSLPATKKAAVIKHFSNN